MKTILCFLALTSSLFAMAKYDLWIDGNEELVDIYVKTKEFESSASPLIISDLKINYPFRGKQGEIDIQIIADPDVYSAAVLTKRVGNFAFVRGNELPKITDGKYLVRIDGNHYGILECSPDYVIFNSFENNDILEKHE